MLQKKQKRLENKCKKMAALLNISKLNEEDRRLQQQQVQLQTPAETVIAAVKEEMQELISDSNLRTNIIHYKPKNFKINSISKCKKRYGNITYYPPKQGTTSSTVAATRYINTAAAAPVSHRNTLISEKPVIDSNPRKKVNITYYPPKPVNQVKVVDFTSPVATIVTTNNALPVASRKHVINEKIVTDEPPKKPKLVSEEYEQLKKELRERKSRVKSIPKIRLKVFGESASVSLNTRTPLFLSDIQHLLLYSLLGSQSPYIPSRWCHLEKCNNIMHTVVLVVEGLTVDHYNSNISVFPNINEYLKHRLEVVTPCRYGGSIAEELAMVPLTGTQRNKLISQYGSLKAAMQSTGNFVNLLKVVFPMSLMTSKLENLMEVHETKNEILPETDKFSRTQLLLSPCQLIEENYPVPLKGELAIKYSNYILTQDEYEEATAKSPMFGLDCEMCRTVTGELELTRVSIVDEKMNLIYDSLVKPDNEITDYLTKYSGITKEMLENITTKLSDVQEFIRILLPPDAILVGQSLNSDLHSLRMMHPYIIDTSVIYNITGDRHKKSKLQTLAREFLDERIQEKKTGHCSTEDSQASMKLVRLKLANTIEFGDAVLINQKKLESNESNLKLHNETGKVGTSLFSQVAKKSNKNAAIVGCSEIMNEYSKFIQSSNLNITQDINFGKSDSIRFIVADNNKNAITQASEILMENSLTYCHLKLDEEHLSENNVNKTFANVDKWVNKIWKGTALHGLVCVIFSGQKNDENGACFLSIKNEITV